MQTIRPVTKPAKQRKRVFQAPHHIRYKLFGAPLSSDLKASSLVKTLPVRSGDTVRIMRGDHKGFEGKVTRVDRKRYKVYVEGLTREKVDGTTIFLPVHPSKVMITSLNLDDKWRKRIVERKKAVSMKVEEVAEKPVEEAVEVKEELVEEKPKRRKRRVTKKPAAKKIKEKAEEKAVEAEKEEAPKPKKTRAKRRRVKKAEEGM